MLGFVFFHPENADDGCSEDDSVFQHREMPTFYNSKVGDILHRKGVI